MGDRPLSQVILPYERGADLINGGEVALVDKDGVSRLNLLQEQLDQERLQKDKLQQLNLKLTRILKTQKGAKEKSVLDLMGSSKQFQTYDGRQGA